MTANLDGDSNMPGPPDGGSFGGRTLSGRIVVLAAALVFLALAVTVASFLMFGDGAVDVVAVRISTIEAEGGSYLVAFDAKGFTPIEDAAFLTFYWDGQNPEQAGVPYWGTSPFSGIRVGSGPPRSERICVALVTRSGEINTGAGECKAIP